MTTIIIKTSTRIDEKTFYARARDVRMPVEIRDFMLDKMRFDIYLIVDLETGDVLTFDPSERLIDKRFRQMPYGPLKCDDCFEMLEKREEIKGYDRYTCWRCGKVHDLMRPTAAASPKDVDEHVEALDARIKQDGLKPGNYKLEWLDKDTVKLTPAPEDYRPACYKCGGDIQEGDPWFTVGMVRYCHICFGTLKALPPNIDIEKHGGS